jgi:ABC-type transport system involved in multi-copper enzyme maturation permease subunit
MRLGEVFRFEIEYRLRRGSTWLYAGLLLGLSFLMLHMVNGGSSRMNSPEMVATISSIVSLVGMLVTAALFGEAATRDIQSRMHPLMYTAPMRTAEYLGGRFLGTLVVNAVMLLGIPLGQLAASQMPYLERRMFGPFIPGAYVQPFLLFLLPNMVLAAALLFTLAALARQMLPAFMGGIGLFVVYLFMDAYRGRITNPTLAVLADPFGMAVLEDLTQYWTPVQQNTQLIGFPTMLLWNRLMWMGVALAFLLLLHRRFRFAHPGGAGGRRKGRRAVADVEGERTRPVAVPVVPRSFGAGARGWQTLAVARRALEEIAGSRAFLVLLAGAVVFVFAFGWNVGAEVFGTASWPVTHLVAGVVLGTALAPVVILLIAVFAGELVWKEREVGASAITDAAPVPDWVSLLGRFLALVAMLIVLQVVLMAAGMMLQALQSYHHYEPGLYLRILFGIKLADYVLLAAVAMAVHVIVNQKYVGHLVVVLFYLFTAFSPRFGLRHHLLVYGTSPGWVYSDMNGFGPFVAPFVWFKLYWAAWALLLAVVARVFWVRGRDRETRATMAFARARLTTPVVRAAGVALALIVTLGGFIFYNTNVLNEYRTPSDSAAVKAEYERRYKRYEDTPQPSIARAELRLELHPRRRAADLRGSYQLVNRTGRAIDSVHVIIHPEVRARSISLGGGARRVLDDDRQQYQVYALARPLAPGDSLRLEFDVFVRPRGFPNSGIATALAGNGTYFDRRWFPIIGYQPEGELQDAEQRAEQGLPPRAPTPAADDPRGRQSRWGLRDAELVHVDAVIGTDADQTAVTVGTLVREWRAGGRRYFHYRTESPLPFMNPYFSARYAVRRGRWKDVALAVHHHPTHDVNVDRMIGSMQASLDYYTTHFGPYPARELRILEFPRYASFARAHPQNIAFGEGSAFLTRVNPGDVDRTFFVVAHETAHQWWGGQVMGANVRGSAFLSESLAQYGAMMVMETALGPEQVRRFYDYEMDHYLQGRRVFTNREVPLLEVDGQAYLHYHKGAVAMYTLREHIGAERVNTALRRYLEKHRAGVPPFPVSHDLYAELRAVTPDSMHTLLHDLFAEITLWDVRAEGARAQPAGGGAYRVTLDVTAAKARADSIGNETAVPMNDLVEIGVFAPAADGEARGAPLYLRRHRLRSGRQTITVTVPRKPARAGIDPLNKLIQREPGDNVVDVQ